MIITELYNGQGLGNQLWSYVVTRTLAIDLGYDFGIMSPEKFKGSDFLNLDFGRKVMGGTGPEGGPPEKLPRGISNYYAEKCIWYKKADCDIRDFDPNLLNIKDNTKIEGYFQSERFIENHRSTICNWLKVNSKFDVYDCRGDELCVLNIRGGEYKSHTELILPRAYWVHAMNNMRNIKAHMKFVIISDDPEYAKALFPDIEVKHESIGTDYSRIKNAKYLILSNSSFAYFPAWTSESLEYVIAPKYWARHNVSDGFWACTFNLYSHWNWQDRQGCLQSSAQCKAELDLYRSQMSPDDLADKPLQKPAVNPVSLPHKGLIFAKKIARKLLNR